MINGEILKAVKTARAVFHPLSKARKTELRSCFSGAFKLSGLSCKPLFYMAFKAVIKQRDWLLLIEDLVVLPRIHQSVQRMHLLF